MLGWVCEGDREGGGTKLSEVNDIVQCDAHARPFVDSWTDAAWCTWTSCAGSLMQMMQMMDGVDHS